MGSGVKAAGGGGGLRELQPEIVPHATDRRQLVYVLREIEI